MSAHSIPSRSSECLVVGLAIFVLALVPVTAEGQTACGGLVGLVRDAQGGVLPGATVTIINSGTNLKRETITDAGYLQLRERPRGAVQRQDRHALVS